MRGGSVRPSSRSGADERHDDSRREHSRCWRDTRVARTDASRRSHNGERGRGSDESRSRRSDGKTRTERASSRRGDSPRTGRAASSRRSDAQSRTSREHDVYVGGGTDRVRSHRNQGLGSSWAADRAASSSWPFATFMPVLGVIAVVLVAVFLVGAISSCSASQDGASQEEEQQAAPVAISFTPSVQSIDGVSNPGATVRGISLADASASYVPQMSDEGAAKVQDAVSAITSDGRTVGFALVDMETGSGYVYNLD
ncbi:MAG: hypothetical protein Q3X03_06375 [Eggerthellaceae bacterium]|nr:hypothetical protein [Eggerthellaceae bacterium]